MQKCVALICKEIPALKVLYPTIGTTTTFPFGQEPSLCNTSDGVEFFRALILDRGLVLLAAGRGKDEIAGSSMTTASPTLAANRVLCALPYELGQTNFGPWLAVKSTSNARRILCCAIPLFLF